MSFEYVNRIKQQFGDICTILGVLHSINEISEFNEFDLLISTIPIDMNCCKTILLTLFFTKDDTIKLTNCFNEIIEERELTEFKEQLQSFFSPQLFEYQANVKQRNDVIHIIAKNMYALGYVKKDFEEKLIEREDMSETCFGNAALPHTLELNAKRTGIYIWINPKGIVWGNTKVKLVLALAIQYNDRYAFRNILNSLTKLLTASCNIEKLITCTTYTMFIDTLVALLKHQ